MSGTRLPAHLMVSALLRTVDAAGGFGTVIARGERDAGVILIVTTEKGANARLWERLPSLDGGTRYCVTREDSAELADSMDEYLRRRTARDPDIWVVELDIADPERFIADLGV